MTRPVSTRSFFPGSNSVESLQILAGAIVTSLPLGVVAFDDNLRIVYVNALAESVLYQTDYLDKSLSAVTESKIWGNWTSSLRSVITSAQTAVFDAVEYSHNSRKKLLKIICSPLKGSGISGGIALIEDITGKDKADHEHSHAERLAAVGKVAGKVAHELNNPMDGILRYINMSQRAIDNGEIKKPKEYLNKCKDGLMRMAHIISQLLEFSRGRYLLFEYAPIDRIVQESVNAMQAKSKNVDICIFCQNPINDTAFRADNLYQVFTNLIKNAIDAMQGDGSLDITIRSNTEEIAVEFKDTGAGFGDFQAASLFEPFFTTKENGKGTGLGLAICKDIIEKYNGRITAENNPDKGSKFTVYLLAKNLNHKPEVQG